MQPLSDLIQPHIDGPHDDSSTTEAARALAEVVRLLNHATRSHPRSAPAAYDLIGALATTTARLDQLLEQLAGRLADLTLAPTVADDRAGDPDTTAIADPDVTIAAANEALQHARLHAEALEQQLAAAHQHTSHLSGSL